MNKYHAFIAGAALVLVSGSAAAALGNPGDPCASTSSANPPIGNTDSYSVAFNSNLIVGTNNGMLGNDYVCSSTSNTVVLASTRVGAPQLVHVQSVSNPSHGQLLFGSDGSFSYTPNNGFFGTDSFTYVINDNNTQPPADHTLLKFTTGPVTVNIQVNPPPVAPTLSQWGLLALLALLGGVAAISFRKRFA